jgi:hypothetical protein
VLDLDLDLAQDFVDIVIIVLIIFYLSGGNYSPVNSPRPSLFSAVIGSSQNNNNNTPNNPEDNQLMDII